MSFELSPIEEIFLRHAADHIPNLKPQVWIGRYRVDFLVQQANVIIELDGHEYHKSVRDRTRDAQRERHLERQGYRVLRFTGYPLQTRWIRPPVARRHPPVGPVARLRWAWWQA